MEFLRKENYRDVMKALEDNQIELFREAYLGLHPYDQATIFEEVSSEERFQIYTYLSPEEMSELSTHMNFDFFSERLLEMNPDYAAKILDDLPTDDAVDILNLLDKNQATSLLMLMDKEEADEIRSLLHYEEKTAGSIMTTEYVVINQNMTIREAMVHLRSAAPDAETIYYVFVVDDEQKLVGVISLRDLIISEQDDKISDVMSDRVVSSYVGDHQEEIAQLMRDYDFLALPVVDLQQHLLGIITVDDILDVMDIEASDDYSKLAAVTDMEPGDQTALNAAKKRLPWLVILLFLGLITASLIGRFEETLDQVAVLAIFIPLIAGMAGNSGTQALAVTVRGLATGEISKEGFFKRLRRETVTGLITGVTCGLLMFFIILVWMDHLYLGIIVGVSIAASLLVATIAGSLMPLLMHKFHIDPAVASGPFITTINDIISVLIYFGLATSFMYLLI
ncbi:magnesium transporter [Allobacillus sp. SKP8-2]|uniref:Magnesium transporter MgtE n=2 Tax=Bacillaceae TaxID=186817 RepID=A0A941CY44_9BACI|nr:magnesium transporter [Allobacillus saliphilus]